jgi:hypothetical protein
MDINEETTYIAVAKFWLNWDLIKDTVPQFGFKDYLRAEHGFTFTGSNKENFAIEIIDKQKFMWFMLKYQ